MAKNKVEIDVKVDDKGSTKKVALGAKEAAKNLDATGRSAQTADRNLKGAARTSANGTKNFSKMSQGVGGLVGVYATLAAQVFAVSAAFQFLKSSTDFNNLIEGQKALGAVSGVAYKTISDGLIAATNGQLKYAEAAKAAAIGTASGLSPTQLNGLASAAKNVSIVLGRDLADSFDRLIRGVTKAEPELLDELGIILRLEPATKKYAATLNKTAKDLTAFERSQAVANEVLSQAELKFGAIEALMDPSSQALNQFAVAFDEIVNSIKTGIAGPLASIATFLSKNMYALIGVVSLFGLSILRSILPSMEEWKKSSALTKEAAATHQEEIRAELKLTRIEYDKLSASQKASLNTQSGTAKDILKEGGVKAPKSGGGAVGYLTGTADPNDKRAQLAADKALTTAETQLALSAKKRTGILRRMNAQQVADLRLSYNIRAGILKEGEVMFHASTERMKLSYKSLMLSMRSGLAGLQVGLATLGGVASRVIGFLGWVGMAVSLISIAVDLGKTFLASLNPITEAEKKLGEETEALTAKYKTLNEEMARTIKVLNGSAGVAIDASTRFQTIGNSITSADIPALIADINRLDKANPKYKELYAGLEVTIDNLAKLDPEFAKLKGSLESTKSGLRGTKPVTDAAAASWKVLANTIQETGLAFKNTADFSNATEASISKLIGTLNTPFGADVMSKIDANITNESVKAKRQGKYRQELQQAQNNLIKDTTLTAPQARDMGIDPNGNSNRSHKVVKDAEGKNLLASSEEGKKIIAEATALFQKELADIDAAMGVTQDRLTLLGKRANVFSTAIEEVTTRQDASKTVYEDINGLLNVGVTIQGKLDNLEADRMKDSLAQDKLLDKKTIVLAKQKFLTDEIADAGGITTEEQRLQLLSLDLTVKVTDQELINMEKILEVKEAQRAITEEELRNSKLVLVRKQLEYDVARKILDVSRQRKRIEGGLTGSFGFGRALELQNNTLDSLKAKLDSATIAANTASIALQRLRTQQEGGTASASEVQGGEQAFQSASDKVSEAAVAIAIQEQLAANTVLATKAETEYAAARLTTLSMNPVQQAFNNTIIENQKKGIYFTEEQKTAILAQTEAQYFLNEAYENTNTLYSSLADNMASAFTSLIDGTKSAKQAFADMAVAILGDIARMITKMLVMRLIMQFMPGLSSFGPTAAAPALSQAGRVAGVADMKSFPMDLTGRYGGVMSAGNKLPGYSMGGVAKGAQAGYPAVLHGTEAVVPLPNGRSIPVEMQGNNQNNNVTVNVALDGNGNGKQNSQANGKQGENLGSVIAAAVQKELLNQKRAGGILSPYGA